MYKDLFYAYSNDFNSVYIQHWAGNILSNTVFVRNFNDLKHCHNKIILINSADANYNIDLVRQLHKQKNLLIFHELSECATQLTDFLVDCPEFNNYIFILGGHNHKLKHIKVDMFYFTTLTDFNILRAKTYTIPETFKRKNKPYKFLYLNGADRPHRRQLWNSLNQEQLLNHALKSYLGYSATDFNLSNTIPLTTLPQEYESPFTDFDKLLQWQNDPRNYASFKADVLQGQWVDGHIVPAQYHDTYFSLVAETTLDDIFVTEKTYKPLLAGHPFIIAGAPGFYQELHKQGFQTFNGIIDESFNFEEDHTRRLAMIVAETKRLCSSDLDYFLSSTREICLFNHNHYINNRINVVKQTHDELNRFFLKLVDQITNTY